MKFYEIAATTKKWSLAYDLSPRARSEVAVTGDYMRPRSPKSASDGSDFPGAFGAADSTGDWK